MIRHTKTFLFILTIFITCLSCKKAIAVETNSIEKKNNVTAKQPIQKTEIFSFYKAFEFCDNEIAYFTKEEADKLYADKKIEINLNNGKIAYAQNVFTTEKLACITKTLDLQDIIEVKIFKTKDAFPFDNLTLLNNNYLITSRDGYFFVFSTIQSAENNITENKTDCKEFEEEMTSGEECIIYNTTINTVYDNLIQEKKLDGIEFLEKKLPLKGFVKEINNNGLITITYNIKKDISRILMRYDGGETTIELKKTGNNVIRKIIYSAD